MVDMEINITICDDEYTQIEYLNALVSKWAIKRNIVVYISEYMNAESFLFAYEDNKTLDILLLDIQMKNMDGVELARRIRIENEVVQIIFITGYTDFISEGYEVSALHYLIKPIKEEKLYEVLDKAITRLHKVEKTILINTANEIRRINLNEILYIEAFAHSVKIATNTGAVETKIAISEINKMLNYSFIRCHRSYIVGLKHISHITKTDVILDNGLKIPLARRLYKDVNHAFINYYRGGK